MARMMTAATKYGLELVTSNGIETSNCHGSLPKGRRVRGPNRDDVPTGQSPEQLRPIDWERELRKIDFACLKWHSALCETHPVAGG
jgi:hypothetical protein